MARSGFTSAMSRFLRALIVAVAITGVMLASSSIASAEAIKVADEKGPAMQDRWNQLTTARFGYSVQATSIIIKLDKLSRQRTRVFANIDYPDAYLRFKSFGRNGRTVVKARLYGEDGTVTKVPAEVRWIVKRGKVIIAVDNTLNDPRPENKRAQFSAFAVQRGAFHGPNCPPKQGSNELTRCNDDYVSTTVDRS